jgi:hypothetical protein
MAESPDTQQLLYSRQQTAQALGYRSVASVIRLQREGVLRPIRLTKRRTGQVFYSVEEVRALASAKGGVRD